MSSETESGAVGVSRSRWKLIAGGIAVVVVIAVAATTIVASSDKPASGPRAGPDPASPSAVPASSCYGEQGPPSAPWMGESTSTDFALPGAGPGVEYDAVMVRPVADQRSPAPPVLLLQHGLGGSKCSLLWLARAAAGEGFAAIAWTSPQGADPRSSYAAAVGATRAAFQYVQDQPQRGEFDPTTVGLIGHSMGSIVASSEQGDPSVTPGLKAIVALDNLRRWQLGDPGGATFECVAEREGVVKPLVPALGLAMDFPCSSRPAVQGRDLKLAGFKWWRSHDVDATEIVLRGFNHADLGGGGSTEQKQVVTHLVTSWFSHYLSRETGLAEMLAGSVGSRPLRSWLSAQFKSARFVPGSARLSGTLKPD